MYIRDTQPPRDPIDSMARQMKAEREKPAQILEEGSRQSEVLRADGQKQAAVLEAEGRKEDALRDAEAGERLTKPKARATQVVPDAIANGSVQAINRFVAQNDVEAFEALATAPSQKLLPMPMESSGIIGSIAGIANLAKEALATPDTAGVRVPPMPPRARLSHALGRGGVGGAVDHCRDLGAWCIPAVDGYCRGRGRGVRAGAGSAGHAAVGADRGVRAAQLRVGARLAQLVWRQAAATRASLAQPARRAIERPSRVARSAQPRWPRSRQGRRCVPGGQRPGAAGRRTGTYRRRGWHDLAGGSGGLIDTPASHAAPHVAVRGRSVRRTRLAVRLCVCTASPQVRPGGDNGRLSSDRRS